ncbi:uncharacterized protein [Littorina saxatilis]|uniref:Uncharacterized protein n=1 Tax=Littorina saxatilis TaxID=31220 RepID=A0AAN9G3K3_9CAEN
MSLFTDTELPPPFTKANESAAESDTDSDVFEQAPPIRPRRLCSCRGYTGYKGLTVLLVITVVSMVMVLYARQRVETIMTQAFGHGPVTVMSQAGKSSWNWQAQSKVTLSPSIEKELEELRLSSQEDQDDVDDEEIDTDPSETFPEDDDTFVSEEKDVWEIMTEFRPLPEMLLHFLWCGNRFLDFRNYLSMKSAIDAIRPKKVLFHYTQLPMTDPDGYFTWFDMLKEAYPNFVPVKVNASDTCYSSGYKRYALLFGILAKSGGIYVPEDAIFVRIMDRFRSLGFVSGISSCNLRYFFEGVVMSRFGKFEIPATERLQVRKLSVCRDPDSLHPCTPDERYIEAPPGHVPTCVRLTSAMFPKDVWNEDDKVSTLAKLVMYGKTDLQPRRNPSASEKTPRIAHYLCTDDCSLSFSVFISILSALHVGGMQRVLIHGPKPPSGVWWDRLQKEPQSSAVYYLHREFSFNNDPNLQMTNEMRRYIMRTEILLHFGGVYHDSHVIWTQPLPDQLLEYDVVASPDWHAHGNWPESVNHALLIARAGAKYLQKLLKVFYDNANSDSPWLAEHYLSYRLIELDPTLVYLYPHLQVKCLNHNCHPTWQPGYRSPFRVNRPGQEFDWRTETLTVHWVDSFPELDVDQVKFTSGSIVDIAKHVLVAARIDLDSLA